jgi:hypothetical protein
MRTIPAALREVDQLQRGVATASQLLQAGLTRDTVRSQLEQGNWQRPYRGVYVMYSGEPSRHAQLWAAVLAAGPGAMLSYWTAAETSGLASAASELIHVTLPHARRIPRRPGIVLHYSMRADQALHPVLLPPQTRVEETVLDLAGSARNLDNAVHWVTRGLGRRLTTQDRLRRALDQRRRFRWRQELRGLLSPEAEGLHSVLEYRYHRDVELPHGLPSGTRQGQFRVGSRTAYRDRLYPQYLTVVELDGRAAHPGDERWHDIRRDNATSAGGILTLRYGWLDVTAAPCRVAAEVALALAAGGFRGARPCSSGCAVGQVSPVPGPRPR